MDVEVDTVATAVRSIREVQERSPSQDCDVVVLMSFVLLFLRIGTTFLPLKQYCHVCDTFGMGYICTNLFIFQIWEVLRFAIDIEKVMRNDSTQHDEELKGLLKG